MWEDDWALLGIEPTTELAVIKKAYALRLKVTRPDDDADAYQALRGAYERIQQWAAWERSRATAPEADASPPGPLDTPQAVESATRTPDEPQPAPEPAPLPEPMPEVAPVPVADGLPPIPPVEPRALTERLELAWRRGDAEGLRQAWADVRQVLDAQPLARQAAFSSAFAQWLVNLPQLPDSIAATLNDHFGWQGDFRTERQIGPALAHALQDALAERFPPPVEPGIVALAEPLLRLARLLGAGQAWRPLWMAFLLHPTLARLQAALGTPLLRRLGLEVSAQTALRRTIRQGFWMRAAVCTLLVGGVAWLNAGDGGIVIGQTIYWAVSVGLLTLLGVLAGAFLNQGPVLQHGERRLALPLTRWRQHRLQPALGLAWMLFAAWLAAASPGDDLRNGSLLSVLPPWAWTLASIGFAVAGLAVAWPLEAMHGLVLACAAPLVAYLADAALGRWMPLGSAVLIGWAWMLLGAAVFSQRLPAQGVLAWLVRPLLNMLALAERWSLSVALAPLAAALAVLVLRNGHASGLTVFGVWAVGQLVVSWAQLRLEAAAARWLPAPAAVD